MIEVQLIILGKVALSMFLSGLVGLERELKDHSAGLRTHMLIGGAAALFVLLGEWVTESISDVLAPNVIEADPVRILQAIVIGISFIGAGTILQDRKEGRVVGLTTASSMLLIAGVGVSVAIDQYIVAIGVTVLTLLVLHIVHLVEQRWSA